MTETVGVAPTPTVTLGGVELKGTEEAPTRFSMVLWGQAKSGKTTLASTAPGPVLWLSFDPDGTSVLLGRKDIIVADFSAEKSYVIVPKLRGDDPIGLVAMLKSRPDIKTVVVDSLTMLRALCLSFAVTNKKLSKEEPGQRGYSVCNSVMMEIIRSILRVTQELGRNVILIAHEAAADKDDKGNVISVSLALSDSLQTNLTALPSEVWHVSDVDGKRRIAVRPCRQRSPMGTRMFDTSSSPEFDWKFDPLTWKGQGIADWFKVWQERGRKIPLPS